MALDDNFILQTLSANKDKGFVNRMYAQTPMTLDLGNGQHATHKMAWTESDGKYLVYPTVLFNGTKLVDYGDKAIDQAIPTGNYIEFNSPEEADYFSKNYKRGLKNPIFR